MLDWTRGSGRVLANNSVRNRLGLARTFLRWCDRRGIGPGLDLEEEFAVLRRSYPATYGKVQDRNPARYLDPRRLRATKASRSHSMRANCPRTRSPSLGRELPGGMVWLSADVLGGERNIR